MSNLIRDARATIAASPLTLNEAFHAAERQAAVVAAALKATGPPLDLGPLLELPDIEVQLQPRHRMPTLAGYSEQQSGSWRIVINRDAVPGRRRFTLAHELKHILDHPLVDELYGELGDDDRQRERQIEWVCNYFAACLLMPAPWLRRLWRQGLRDEVALAELFQVSAEAMHNRLIYLGYLHDDRRPLVSYFRSDARHPRGRQHTLAVLGGAR